VVERMARIMEVTARFQAQLRPIALPGPEDRATLLGYLQTHALRPLVRPEATPPAYQALCGDCHAAPDPAAYRGADWPALLARMSDHRQAMARPPVEAGAEARVRAHLGVDPAPAADQGPQLGRPVTERYGRWLALGPLVALAVLGAGRWWLHRGGRA
jgi:hypothetical protein